MELGRIGVAHAHRLGHAGDAVHRADHHRAEQQVEQHQHDPRNGDVDQHKQVARLGRTALGHRHGHADDLGADDLVQPPAETVLGAVEGHHRFRGRLRGAVAAHAARSVDQGAGKVEHRPGGRLAHHDQLGLFRMGAEIADDVRLPVARPVLQVGRVERRLAVAVVAELRVQDVEVLLRGVGGNGLGMEGLVHILGQQGLHLFGGVFAGPGRAFHHDARLLQHLRLGHGHQDWSRSDSEQRHAGDSGRDKEQIELAPQTHATPSPGRRALWCHRSRGLPMRSGRLEDDCPTMGRTGSGRADQGEAGSTTISRLFHQQTWMLHSRNVKAVSSPLKVGVA